MERNGNKLKNLQVLAVSECCLNFYMYPVHFSLPLVLVAEVTQPSLGVGYEIGRAVALNKTIICLFRPDSGKSEFLCLEISTLKFCPF